MTIDKENTRVRRYRDSDIPRIIEILFEELPKMESQKHITLDEGRMKFLLEKSAKDESAFLINVLVNEKDEIVGGAGAYCVTHLLSWDKVTSDLFLFVDPNWRTMKNVAKIIGAYKDWAVRRGAKIIGASHTAGYRGNAFDLLLQRNGGERVGAVYYFTDVM